MTNPSLGRRRFLALGISFLGMAIGRVNATEAQSGTGPILGKPQPFNFDWLIEHAHDLAQRPFVHTPPEAAELIKSIDFDAVQKIKFRNSCGLWSGQNFPVRFLLFIPTLQWPFVGG